MKTMQCKEIKNLVENYYGGIDLRSKSRQRDLAYARFVFAGLCKAHAADFHHNEVAFLTRRHRTSVNHALSAFDDNYDKPWGKDVTSAFNYISKEIERRTLKQRPPAYNRTKSNLVNL